MQLVVIADKQRTFAFFRYSTLSWSNAAGEPESPLGYSNVPAWAGAAQFGLSDASVHPFPGAGTSALLGLSAGTNVGIPGLWAMRVDSEAFEPICGPANAGVWPASGSVTGGTLVTLSGACFEPSDVLMCRFGNASSSHMKTHATYIDASHISCAAPLAQRAERVPVSFTQNGGFNWTHAGAFQFLRPDAAELPRAFSISVDAVLGALSLHGGWLPSRPPGLKAENDSFVVAWPATSADLAAPLKYRWKLYQIVQRPLTATSVVAGGTWRWSAKLMRRVNASESGVFVGADGFAWVFVVIPPRSAVTVSPGVAVFDRIVGVDPTSSRVATIVPDPMLAVFGIGLPGTRASARWPNNATYATTDAYCAARVRALAPPSSAFYTCPVTRTLATVSAGFTEDPTCAGNGGASAAVSPDLAAFAAALHSSSLAATALRALANASASTQLLLRGNCATRQPTLGNGGGAVGAASCFVRASRNTTTQCCYDANGQIIDAGPGAGGSARFSEFLNPLSSAATVAVDELCCRLAGTQLAPGTVGAHAYACGGNAVNSQVAGRRLNLYSDVHYDRRLGVSPTGTATATATSTRTLFVALPSNAPPQPSASAQPESSSSSDGSTADPTDDPADDSGA